jgi:hypothetical protein
MKLGLGCCLLVTLGLISCGGTSGSTSVNGDNPNAIKTAPAGVSTLTFMDIELVRPDTLTGASGLPTGVTANGTLSPQVEKITPEVGSPAPNPATLTFNNVTAANGGVINGSITLGWTTSGATTTYTETFNNLTVTPATAVTPAWSWVYSGAQQIAVTGTTAIVTTPSVFLASYNPNPVPPNNSSTYQFIISSSNPLTVNWTDLSAVSLLGDYQIALPTVFTVTVDLSPALVWNTQSTPSCGYPISGTLSLDLNSATLGNATTTVVFGSTCGQMTISGATLNLGQ